MWYLTFDDRQIVNLSLAARIRAYKDEKGMVDVVADVPGWHLIEKGNGYILAAGYVPVRLVSCGNSVNEAEEIVRLFYRALRAGVCAADLDKILDFEKEEDAGDAGDD
ncbi:MAG: hypothetical protein ACPLQO_11160 [Desulfotomaculales bacterium]